MKQNLLCQKWLSLQRNTRYTRVTSFKVKNRPESNDRIPLTLTNHLLALPVKKIIYYNFKILQNETETKNIFTSSPLTAFQRDTNLYQILLKSCLTERSGATGTSACGRSNCLTCRHINTEQRKTLEKRLIRKLRTLLLAGVNKHFSFS